MGSYKVSHKSSNIGYNYSYPTYNPNWNYPLTLNPIDSLKEPYLRLPLNPKPYRFLKKKP